MAFDDALKTIAKLGGEIVDNVQFSKWRPLKGMRDELSNDISLREGRSLKIVCISIR